jgi:hypothetical protein
VIRFGSPDVEVCDVYEVPLRASGMRSITVGRVAVESIYNGHLAKCPHNITLRFLQGPGYHRLGTCIGLVVPWMSA